jgi:protein-S-isoprenylcysteine O-methyltransferase Ste14
MDGLPIASMGLRVLAGVTILFQTGLLAAAPIPSPVSSRRVWARRGADEASFAETGAGDPIAARLPPAIALAGLLAVIVAVIWPEGAGAFLLPAGTLLVGGLAPAGGICLLAGNALIALAVVALRRNTGFDAQGQSNRLVTDGVFGWMRHPIAAGTGMIYLGFFLALPSPLVLGGLLGYGWHQQRRLGAEEELLARRFGPRYRAYRRRVGRFGPNWPGRPEGGPRVRGKE